MSKTGDWVGGSEGWRQKGCSGSAVQHEGERGGCWETGLAAEDSRTTQPGKDCST